MTFRGFLSRSDLGLRAPRSRSTNIDASRGGVIRHHAGGAQGVTSDHGRCVSLWRGYQRYHMDTKGWVDIAYTGGVCQHGYALAGRGAGVRTAANGTNDANFRYYAICWIGGGNERPTEDAIDAFWWFRNNLTLHGDAGPQVKDHRDFRSTTCPGNFSFSSTPPSGSPDEEADMIDRNTPNGPGVAYFQEALQGWNPDALPQYGADGDYGDETEEWVRKYQRAAGLHVTGTIGGATATLLGRHHPEWKGVRGKTAGGGGKHIHAITGSLSVAGRNTLGTELAKNLKINGKLGTGEAG